MPGIRSYSLLLTLIIALATAQASHAFSFSENEERESQEENAQLQAEQSKIDSLMAIPCRSELKEKKIAIIIGEQHDDGKIMSKQSNYGILFQEINKRMNRVGMKTYSQEEITAQVAQAEIDAFLSNNMDAASSAASRLQANFILRGMIQARSNVNPVIGIKEVFISMAFTLVDSSGHIISSVTAEGDSYSGQDTMSVSLDLVRKKADQVVAELYHDYCSSLAAAEKKKAEKPHDKPPKKASKKAGAKPVDKPAQNEKPAEKPIVQDVKDF